MNGVGTRGNASGGSSWGAAAVLFLPVICFCFFGRSAGCFLLVFIWIMVLFATKTTSVVSFLV
jgi:hypothetical protein